ncbi:MAG TPA: tetratricopeptide repeat protein [Candidatus Angelobacter sp.]
MKKLAGKTTFLALLLCLNIALVAQESPVGKQAQPAGKHVPQAKTHPEFNDYNAAYAIAGGAASEKAADEFAAKYPGSELKAYLYSKAMHEYQNENNPAKMLSVGEKVLQLDPDNSIALVLTATVLADGLSETDTDKQAKIAQVKRNTAHALDTLDSAFTPPANASPEQVVAYKNTLKSMAHSALGIVALKTGDDATAESELKLSTNLNQSQPDPYLWYHLALAQDHQKKYQDALASINRALQIIGSNAELGELAKGEQKRLQTLTGGSTPTMAPK